MAAAWVRVDGVVRHYAWGSRRVIADLQGRPAPSAEPEAELWFGAHEACPSPVADDPSGARLDGVIAADPVGWLGAEVAERFGGRLPFLVKILAIAEPLSLQVHPGDGDRDVDDPWPKPELLCALGEVSVLCGFRPQDQLVGRLARLPGAAWLADDLAEPAGFARMLTTLLRWPAADRAGLVAAVVEASCQTDGELDAPEWIAELAARHPADPAVAVAWLLQPRRLRAGEALAVPAGTPHCYLRGTAVEAMASSDSVVRAGLTTKPVDVERFVELLAPDAPPEVAPGSGGGRTDYPASTPFFAVSRGPAVSLGPLGDGPELILVVDGTATLQAAGASLTLAPGQAALVRAGGGTAAVRVEGAGTTYRIRCPVAPGPSGVR